MALLKKTPIHTISFFLFLCSVSIKMYSQGLKPNLREQQSDPIVYPDTVILNSPVLPVIFDATHLNLVHALTPECPLTKPLFPPLRFTNHKLFADVYQKNAINRYAYDYVIQNNIKQLKYTIADFTGKVKPVEKIGTNIFQFLFKVDYEPDYEKVAKPERYTPKRRYWIYSGNHKIQLSQNYISENWYKGGVKNVNLINRHNLSFNYKKNKFQTNNLFEWKLNVYTNPNDTIRYGSIGEDLVRTYSDFGIQAINNWYYSSNIEIKTQLFKNYKENTDQAISSAFAPLYVNVGLLGMRYQIEKGFPKVRGKKVNFNTDISPLSVKYIAVLNKNIDPQRFGIEEESWHLINIGSTVNAKLVVYFNKYVNFTSRFYYFTNYETITAELENTLNMPINRYFSTVLYLFVRYDDNKQITKDPTLGYFQINELLSFGFNYSW
ncbi:MAG: DUF3078 domain-containing protein [Candidatus Azobacteroides sp.]|nr:DUF3078 domain-containing protein [Candidatus Azobacteroides sp.]